MGSISSAIAIFKHSIFGADSLFFSHGYSQCSTFFRPKNNLSEINNMKRTKKWPINSILWRCLDEKCSYVCVCIALKECKSSNNRMVKRRRVILLHTIPKYKITIQLQAFNTCLDVLDICKIILGVIVVCFFLLNFIILGIGSGALYRIYADRHRTVFHLIFPFHIK